MPAVASPSIMRAMCGLALALAGGSAGAADFAGRGVFPFASTSGCPLVGAGTTTEPCNRIALDDAATRASVDSDARAIRFVNDRSYSGKTVVGDVLLQGSGKDARGKRVPLNFHLVLSKLGRDWSFNSHAHAPVSGEFSEIQIDPYEIGVGDGKAKPRVLVTAAEITQVLAHPSLAARMANQLVQVTDNRAGKSTDSDLTIGIGVGKATLPVMRASLHAEPLPGDAGNAAVLDQGTWQLQLHALTGKIPEHVAQRDLFLFGMAGEPLLQPLVKRGFAKGDTLTIGAVAGQGYLRYGEREQSFPGAAATARHFMQQSFIGLILGWQRGAELGAR